MNSKKKWEKGLFADIENYIVKICLRRFCLEFWEFKGCRP